MRSDDLVQLLRHMEWADALVWRAALALSADAAASDPSLRERLLHIHVVQLAFLSMWRGDPLGRFPEPDDFPALADVARWARPYYAQAASLVGAADAAALARPIRAPWAESFARRAGGGTVTHPTLAETVVHIASHSTYHRGQVNLQIRRLGGEPPLTDLIAWIWLGRPEPQWDAAPGGGDA